MTSPSDFGSKPARSRLRISIRGLLVLVLFVAAWLGWFVHSARQQREAVEVIERRGGSVIYGYQYRNDGVFDITAECPWPEWLVNAVGIDALCTVVDAHSATGTTLAYRDLTDADLEFIGRLRHLERLSIVSPDVTEAGLRHLGGLGRLEQLLLKVPKAKGFLDLGETKVTDAGMAHLTGLVSLRSIHLVGTSVGDAGAAHLGQCPSLGQLDLRNLTGLTDVGFAPLVGLKNLSRIDVTGTRV